MRVSGRDSSAEMGSFPPLLLPGKPPFLLLITWLLTSG